MHIKNVSTSKMVTLAIILAVALFLLPNISHAATAYFNSPQSTIESSFNGIVGGVYNAAKELFMGLAFIEVTWFFIIVTINRREMDFIVVEALKKVMSLGLFYAFLSVTANGLSDGNWFYYFANHMGTLGASLGGATAKSPTSLIDQGLTNFGNLLNAPFQGLAASTQVQGYGVIGNWIGSAFKSMNVVAVLMAIWLSLEILPPDIVMLLAYVLLALRVFMINIEMYFVLSVGILLLGAGGSRWTTQYARNYINYTVSVGIRLFTIYVVAGICDNLMMKQAITLASIAKELANGSQVSNLIPQVWGMGVTFFSIALLILMVPKFAANLASGQSTAGVGDVLAPAAAVAAAAVGAGALAAGGAAGLMGAGKALGNATGGSVGGGSGVMSVADAAKMGDGAGSGGFGGSVSGGAGPAGGTPPGSGSGNGTGTAPGIAPASLSPEAIKSQLQNFTPNPIGQNKQGAGAPTKPAASPSSPGNAPAASGGDAAQSEQIPAETLAANGDAGSTDTAPNGDSMSMSKGPDGKPQVSATTTRPDGALTHTTAGGSQTGSKQVSGPTSTGAVETPTAPSGGGGTTQTPQQPPDLNKTLERLNQTMENMGKAKTKTLGQNVRDMHSAHTTIKRAVEDLDGNQAVNGSGSSGGHLGSE